MNLATAIYTPSDLKELRKRLGLLLNKKKKIDNKTQKKEYSRAYIQTDNLRWNIQRRLGLEKFIRA